MFEVTLANWPPAARLLAENVSEWFMLFGVLHKLAIGFAVVSVELRIGMVFNTLPYFLLTKP